MATIAQFKRVLKEQLDSEGIGVGTRCITEKVNGMMRDRRIRWRNRFWTPLQTVWTFLWQVLQVDSSCREAVAMALARKAAEGPRKLPSGDPSAYCQARKRLPLDVLGACVRQIGRREWKALPQTLAVRLIRFAVDIPGFRCKTVVVATTLLDPIAYPVQKIAALYRDRWLIELRFRDIKTTMGMDVLRGKTADIVRKEIAMHLLAYNMIRCLMWQAAVENGLQLHRLSFAGTVDRLNAMEPYLQLYQGSRQAKRLYKLLLSWIVADLLPHRPNRVEPRAVKRRPKEYPLFNRPRHKMRKALPCK